MPSASVLRLTALLLLGGCAHLPPHESACAHLAWRAVPRTLDPFRDAIAVQYAYQSAYTACMARPAN